MFSKILSIAGVFLACLSITIAQPKLEIVGGETFDWGKVKPPTSGHLEATIKMKNVGTGKLKLVEVRPGCGCTKTDPDKMEMGPDEVSSMSVKLNIGPAQGGPITKSVTITWGDDAGLAARDEFHKSGKAIPADADTTQHMAFLYLKADIQRPIMVQPSIFFAFSDLKIGVASTAKVEILNNDDIPITFSDWVTENGLIINQSGKVTVKPGEKMELIATLVPGQKGSYAGAVKCKTSHPDNPDLDIRAYGNVLESQSPVFQTNTPK
ncbi:MAG: DUF1573 domain-containing protein [Ignavibacteria bacterium]|nr:DUF1573 domain-containing protein [Ignavibacteria bacterium]